MSSYSPSSKKILVTGASQFPASNLIDYLLYQGHRVVGVDYVQNGLPKNLKHLAGHPRFQLVCHNMQSPLSYVPAVDQIYHLNTSSTQKDSFMLYKEVEYLLRFAARHHARVVLSGSGSFDQTSYPDTIRIASMGNIYGPRMGKNETLVARFVSAALEGRSITVTDEANSVESFEFVDDCVRGVYGLMNGDADQGVSIKRVVDVSVGEVADMVADIVADVTGEARVDVNVDARHHSHEMAKDMEDGLRRTVEWYIKDRSECFI